MLHACNEIPDHAKFIPEDAQLVGSINMNKMTKKLIWNALTGSDLFKEMLEKTQNEDAKNAMKDFGNLGLDQNSSIYFYANGKKDSTGSSCVIAGMKDVAKFEAFLKKTYPQLVIEKGSTYSSILIENKILAAWNKEAALFYPLFTQFDANEFNASLNFDNLDKIKSGLKETFSLSRNKSILSNKHFTKLQDDDHDLSVWLNYEQLYLNNADASANPFIKQDYFKESALATGIDFEKGKAIAVMDYYMSKDIASIYKRFEPKNIDINLIKNIPSKDIAMLMGYNMNPKMIQEYLKKFGLDGLLNMGLGLAGTNMDNIANTFKGDMVFALSDIKLLTDSIKEEKGGSGYDLSPEMNMTFAMSILDQDLLQKLLGVSVKNNILVKNGNSYSLPQADSKGGLAFNKKSLVYSTDEDLSNAFLAGTSNSKEFIPSSVWSHLSANPMMMYVDVKKIMQNIPVKTDEKEEADFMIDAKKFFTYVEFYGGKMKNNAVHLDGAVFLSNENENALIQILNLGMKAKKMNEEKEKIEAPNTTSDSSLIQ
jgi:hypothetical protein